MKVLALDISTKTGFAVQVGEPGNLPEIIETGLLTTGKPVSAFGEFPWNYVRATRAVGDMVRDLVARVKPDLIVIEEVNIGRSRYTQKTLDFLHLHVLMGINETVKVVYVNTSDWRRKLSVTLTKEDRKQNATVRKLKAKGDKKGLQDLGVRGKIGKKHVAVRWVNETYGLQLKLKDNDIADAICQGVAWFLGVQLCDGK